MSHWWGNYIFTQLVEVIVTSRWYSVLFLSLQAERLRRMRGGDDKTIRRPKHISADDLNDGFILNKDDRLMLSYKVYLGCEGSQEISKICLQMSDPLWGIIKSAVNPLQNPHRGSDPCELTLSLNICNNSVIIDASSPAPDDLQTPSSGTWKREFVYSDLLKSWK